MAPAGYESLPLGGSYPPAAPTKRARRLSGAVRMLALGPAFSPRRLAVTALLVLVGLAVVQQQGLLVRHSTQDELALPAVASAVAVSETTSQSSSAVHSSLARR